MRPSDFCIVPFSCAGHNEFAMGRAAARSGTRRPLGDCFRTLSSAQNLTFFRFSESLTAIE